MDPDRQLAAFYRLLADASLGGHARVDAIVALAQRTVWVVPWPDPSAGWRTLVNSGGNAALPIFTSRAQLDQAATRFGWVGPDGQAPGAEVGSREALRYARDRSLSYVIVDLSAPHALELTRDEIDPLLTPAARRDTGPFAGTGRVSSTLMRAVTGHTSPTPAPMAASRSLAMKMTPPPGSLRAVAPAPIAPPSGKSSPGELPAVAADGPPSPVRPSSPLAPLAGPPDEAMLTALETVLRDYPEVELACLGTDGAGLAIGIRMDLRLRTRLEPLAKAIGAVSHGTPIVMLDDAAHLRTARNEALMFFPWRRR